VLSAQASRRVSDYSAGVRSCLYTVRWNLWQPSSATRDDTYAAARKAEIDAYRNQGWKFGLDFGMHYGPTWVRSATGGTPTDQNGAHPSGNPVTDIVWNQACRDKAAVYIQDVLSYVGLTNIYYIKLSGTGSNGETVMPSPVGSNGWWLGSTAPTAAANTNPLPGWNPGTTGHTASAIQNWYENYYHAQLVDTLVWEIDTIRAAGYTGPILSAMPGTGANLWVYRNRIAANLTAQSYDGFSTMNSGAVYQLTIPALAASGRSNLWVQCSSLADNSGNPADNQFTAADLDLPFPPAANSATENAMTKWSASRWQTNIAMRHDLPMSGESTGGNSAADMAIAVNLAKICGFRTLFWAFDAELYNGTNATISDYSGYTTGV
jgi:hypothetical protein